MTRSIFRLLPLLAATLFATPAAGQNLANLARPDANMMIGVRVADFASTPLAQRMWQETVSSKPEVTQFLSLLGPNPLSLIDEILIAASVTDASKMDQADALILASGKFNEAQLVDLLCQKGCETEMYRGFQLRKALGQDDGPSHFALLDTGALALGSQELVQGAIERRALGAPAAFSGGMTDWINRLGSRQIWIAANGPFPQPPGSGSDGGAQMMSNLTSKVDGFGLGVDVSGDIEMSLDLRTTTEQDAQQFYDMAQGFIAMAKANDQQPEAREFLDKLTLTRDGRILAARMSISQADIERQLAKRGQPDQPATAPRAERRPAPPPPPKRRSGGIRIYGLSEEPLEVPTQKP